MTSCNGDSEDDSSVIIRPADSENIPTGPGMLSFWIKSDEASSFYIDITVATITKRVHANYWGSVPTCTTDGAMTFSLSPGSHEWTGMASDGSIRNGFSNIEMEKCHMVELKE